MGRIFIQHMGGTRLFSCASCETVLTNRDELISTRWDIQRTANPWNTDLISNHHNIHSRFTGATGRAFLFNKVVNLKYSEVQDRVMLTGRHMVRWGYMKSGMWPNILFCNTQGCVLQKLRLQTWLDVRVCHRRQPEVYKYLHMSMNCPLYICQYTIYIRYKEGKVILERALVQECDGIEEHPISDWSWQTTLVHNILLNIISHDFCFKLPNMYP